LAADANDTKKFGLSNALAANVRLGAPSATAAHAFPSATSNLNMLAPSCLFAEMR
jgi:hypothetical protein